MEFTLLWQTKMKSSASRSPARCLLGGAESCRTGRAAQSTATLLRGCGQQRGQRGQQQLFEKQKVRTAGRCARLCLRHAALEAGGAGQGPGERACSSAERIRVLCPNSAQRKGETTDLKCIFSSGEEKHSSGGRSGISKMSEQREGQRWAGALGRQHMAGGGWVTGDGWEDKWGLQGSDVQPWAGEQQWQQWQQCLVAAGAPLHGRSAEALGQQMGKDRDGCEHGEEEPSVVQTAMGKAG